MNSPGTPQVVISCSSLGQRLRQWVLSVSAPVSETGALDESSDANSAAHKRPQLQNIYEEPQTNTEKVVAEIWEQLLGIAPVGVQDDFFALGGHSLLATKLIARMREVFRIDLPLSILFDKPTIREVVGYVVDTWGDAETVEEIARTYREVFSS
jgi:acyl carrier protein